MLGNLVSNIKSRLTARVGDESFSADTPRARNIFFKLRKASYALISQSQDDAYCSDNLFMLPRVYSEKSVHVGGLWSPVSLKPPEKSLDELDDVVEKFIRCISVDSHYDVSRKEMKNSHHVMFESFLKNLKYIFINLKTNFAIHHPKKIACCC